MTEQIQKRLTYMVSGTLSYYASERICEGNRKEADELLLLAERIRTENATEEEWLKAIEEIDLTEPFSIERKEMYGE